MLPINGTASNTVNGANGELSSSANARREILRTLGSALWRFRWRALAAFGLLVTAKLLTVAVPVALKNIVDDLSNPQGPLVLPSFLLLGYAALRFSGGLFTELRDLVFSRVTQTTVADFTVKLFEHLHSLSVRFHVNRQTGALSRDIERGTAGVGFLLGTALFTLLPTIVEIVTVLIILTAGYRPGFAGIVAITFAAYGIFTVRFTEKRIFFQRRLNDLDSQASGQLVDSLLNYESVKFYTSSRLESGRMRNIMNGWIGFGLENQKALSLLHIGQSGIIAFGVGAVMLLAGQEVVKHTMSVGDLVLVNAYIIQICLPLNTLGVIFRQSREALVNAEKMADLLRYPSESDPSAPLPPLHITQGAVEFSNVSFSYDPGRPILHDVDFEIGAGKTVAVVGGSGSGKSTLARLLLRFYDVDGGSVSIDGQDLRSVSQESLRYAIGIVPQDTLLFNNTIGFNIAYGRPGAKQEEIIQAAMNASVHDFIQSLPARYETMVGERGVKLSGGERQRIAIARAILKNPPLLIFDEATSALDSRTERAIQAQLDEIARNRTTLIIAHRLSTIVGADTILVMEQGRIVERGTHDSLMQANGLYTRMWQLQRQQNRIHDEGAKLSAQPVNVVALVAGVLDAVRPMIAEKSINLYTLIGDDTVRVTTDPSALQQVIWELCINAIFVTPPNGRIQLQVNRDAGVAHLSLLDGRPPPSEAAEMPRDDSWQSTVLHVPPDPDRLNALVQEMGGTFAYEPAHELSGLKVILEFPLRAVASLSPPTPSDSALADALREMRIFVVDGQEEARTLLHDALKDYGALVDVFDSGRPLLARLSASDRNEWPDVLLCDLSLGDPDSYAVIDQIRRMEADRQVSLAGRLPVIALSAYTGRENRLRALLAGFQVYMIKPADPGELVATVLAVTRPPRAHFTKALPTM
ncbi:ATP-binding cassette domain-containing protein [Candidimonas sp. SYP-B2681]|uniref:ATP-binding cassette domain-containing protein n=1 Tax=Candidimonas sp. SYP-B2681 TaxID=2497686 RepID=UPI000F87F80F|nr:ATP-binding cassette domain-containing protein [Candidimonas sp. SYP-B2681]RTZ48147.1 ATP-binding cassette domain-containing protein [Candidimonas sp. SYP-B2681]